MELPRRSSPRASRYDYTSEGIYFITICTRNREHFFGEIKNKEMVLNDLGKYCAQEIKNLNERKTVKVHEWIVMPNHVHILLGMDEWLAKYDTHSDALILNSHSDAPSGRPYTNITIQSNTPRKDVLLARPNWWKIIHHQNWWKIITTHPNNETNHNDIYKWPSLWIIVNTFKGNVTKYAQNHPINFGWQSRYHDHIVRNEKEYNNIKFYIQQNPRKRNEGKFWEEI